MIRDWSPPVKNTLPKARSRSMLRGSKALSRRLW